MFHKTVTTTSSVFAMEIPTTSIIIVQDQERFGHFRWL